MGCLKLIYREEKPTLKVLKNTFTSSYRYGFNGQEKTDEISGNGNHYTAEFWEYDPRTGRRWNLDPVVKPWESGYAVMGGNPIWNKDVNGDDFVNASTEKRKAAGVKKDEAQANLNSATTAAKPFEGVTKKEAKAAGNLSEFKAAQSNLKTAQKAFNKAEAIFNQEVENEATVDAALALFKEVNPEQFAKFDKFDPTGRGVIDIVVSGQKDAIQILDSKGFPTGVTTKEGINASVGNDDKSKDFVKVRLQVIKVDGVIQITSITGVLVHAMGHLQGDRSENAARQFQTEQFDNKLKKK